MKLFSPAHSRNSGGGRRSGPLLGWELTGLGRRLLQTPRVMMVAAAGLAVVSAWLALTYPARVAVAMFAAMIAGLAILLEPALGLLAYFNLAFMRPHETFWGLDDTRLTFLVSMFTLGATVIHFALRPNLAWLKKPQVFFTLVLWLFIHLSAEFNVHGPYQAKWLDYYDKMFLIYFVTLVVMTSEKWLFRLAWVITVSIGYLGIWANEMYFLHGWHTVHGPGRKGAAFYDENGFAMILVMVVPFCWQLIVHHRNWIVRAGLAVVMVLTAHGVLVTFSRGGFLGLACTGAVILLRQKNRWLALVMGVLALGFFAAVTGPRYLARIGSIETYEEDASAQGRLESWETGSKMALSHPWFGVGLKRYREEFPNYSFYFPREAHNSWVQLTAECGFIAGGAYGALMILTFVSLWRIRHRLPRLPEESRKITATLVGAYEASLVGYLVCGFFLSMEDFEFYYLLVAMGQILDRVTAERVAEAEAAGMVAGGEGVRSTAPAAPA